LAKYEYNEIPVVVLADTIVDPLTMVVELWNAFIADIAVT
jgi:hypothetical protein